MTTAVDTNILFDILTVDPQSVESKLRIARARLAGTLVISEPVYAELAPRFSGEAELEGFLHRTGIQLTPSNAAALFRAGQAWRRYTSRRPAGITCPSCGLSQTVDCSRCGSRLQSRQHVVADFLIGAHALVQADRLLTRDRGFYGAYFPELPLG